MIGELRRTQSQSPGDFFDGLRAAFGPDADDSLEGEAAGFLLAETLLMHRAWLKGQFENKDGPARGSRSKARRTR